MFRIGGVLASVPPGAQDDPLVPGHQLQRLAEIAGLYEFLNFLVQRMRLRLVSYEG